MHFTKLLTVSEVRLKLESLSTDVFEPRTSTGSRNFSSLTCYNSLFVENNKLISSSLRTWRFHSVVVNQIVNGNFTPNFAVGKLTSSLREKFPPFGEIVSEFPYTLWSSRLGITSFKMSCETLQLNFPRCYPTPT